MVAPLFVGREKSISAIERAFSDKTPLILSSQREPGDDDPTTDDILSVGTRATVLQLFKLPDGSVKAIVEGLERVRIERFEATAPHFVVSYSAIAPSRPRRRPLPGAGPAGDGGVRRRTSRLSPHVPDEVQFVVAQAGDADEIADIVAAHLMVSTPEKQALLETESTEQRLTVLLELLAQENAVLGLEQEIAAQGPGAHRDRSAPDPAAGEAQGHPRRDRRRGRRRGGRLRAQARRARPARGGRARRRARDREAPPGRRP